MRRIILLLVLAALALPGGAAEAPAVQSILLVAHRKLSDPFFRESVVLVTHAGGRAPMGVIINQPTVVPLTRVLPQAKGLSAHPEARLYFGGPVARDRLVFVFRAKEAPDGALPLVEDLYLSWDASLLESLLERDDPLDGLRVYAGHAGWAPRQLEAEIARGDWHMAGADAAAVFEKRPEELWKRLERKASAQRIRLDTKKETNDADLRYRPG